MFKKLLLLVAALAAVTGFALGEGGAAHAATPAPLSVTLSASNDGASATWNAAGNPVLTLGTQTSSTYAQVKVNLASSAEPTTPPSFTTDNYAAGSPRWYIQLSDGYYLFGYPVQLGGTANASFTGDQWSAQGPGGNSTGGGYVTYQKALAFADPAGAATVSAAYVLADGDQPAGTHDTLTNVQYGGRTLQTQYSGLFVMKNGYSGKCLNIFNGNYSATGTTNQYTCLAPWHGLPGGAQRFKYATFADGTQYLEAISPDNGSAWFVQATSQGAPLSLTNTPVPYVYGTGGFFSWHGLVADDAAFSKSNLTVIWGWPKTGVTNQRWALLSVS